MAAAGDGGTVLPHLDDVHVLRWRERLRAGFWVVPAVFVVGALLLSVATLWLVLQLTSSQFSPRVLRTFLRDRSTQVSLGVFVATFA